MRIPSSNVDDVLTLSPGQAHAMMALRTNHLIIKLPIKALNGHNQASFSRNHAQAVFNLIVSDVVRSGDSMFLLANCRFGTYRDVFKLQPFQAQHLQVS